MANLLLKRIKDWATSITAFRTGDVIPVDGPSGTAKMTKDNLLKETAQNALAGNVAPAFDPTKPNDASGYAYYADEIVAYNGATYKFKVNHFSGAWNASEVDRYDASDCLEHLYTSDNDGVVFAAVDALGNSVLSVFADEQTTKEDACYDDVIEASALCSSDLKFVRTLGFYYKNDDGGALYEVVSSTDSTPNGIDIISTSSGDVCLKLVVSGKMNIEQFGGRSGIERFDNGVIINRVSEVGVKTLLLANKTYYTSTTITPGYAFSIIGDNATIKCYASKCFILENRYFQIKKVSIYYVGASPITDRNVIAFYSASYSGSDHYMYLFEDLVVNNFGQAFRFWGSIKWYVYFYRVRANVCGVGAHITNGFNLYFEGFGLNHCSNGIVLQGIINAVFVSCGLGTDGGPAISCISEHSNDLVFEDGSECKQNIKFVGCDFETDTDFDESEGAFLTIYHKYVIADICFDTCWFTSNNILKNGAYGIALNDFVSVVLLNDLFVLGDNSLKPYLWNPNHPPRKEVGSVKFIGKNNFVERPFWGNSYYPCVIDNDGVIQCYDIESMPVDYPNVKGGTMVYDVSSDKLYCKVGNLYKEI